MVITVTVIAIVLVVVIMIKSDNNINHNNNNIIASPADLQGAPGDQDGFTGFPDDDRRLLN